MLITGPPGSGKSFLIDLWFSTFPTPFKARKHYNELVLEIYRAVWEETRRGQAALVTRFEELAEKRKGKATSVQVQPGAPDEEGEWEDESEEDEEGAEEETAPAVEAVEEGEADAAALDGLRLHKGTAHTETRFKINIERNMYNMLYEV